MSQVRRTGSKPSKHRTTTRTARQNDQPILHPVPDLQEIFHVVSCFVLNHEKAIHYSESYYMSFIHTLGYRHGGLSASETTLKPPEFARNEGQRCTHPLAMLL